MKKIAFLCCTLTISSCATLMKSEQELLNTGGKSPVYCAKIRASELKAATEQYLNKCYLKTKKVVMNGVQVSADYNAYKKETPESTMYFLVASNIYYNRAILVKESSTDACLSEVQVYAPKKNAAADSSWFEPFKKIAEGKEPSCLM